MTIETNVDISIATYASVCVFIIELFILLKLLTILLLVILKYRTIEWIKSSIARQI